MSLRGKNFLKKCVSFLFGKESSWKFFTYPRARLKRRKFWCRLILISSFVPFGAHGVAARTGSPLFYEYAHISASQIDILLAACFLSTQNYVLNIYKASKGKRCARKLKQEPKFKTTESGRYATCASTGDSSIDIGSEVADFSHYAKAPDFTSII